MNAFLDQRRTEGNYRQLMTNRPPLDFSSNDYLGLSQSPEIRRVLIDALANGCPLGSTGSRLLSGQTIWHEQVENFLAETFGTESALLFSSGFTANLGVLSSFGGDETYFFSDQLNHASLIDGIKLAKSPCAVFRHNDMNSLADLLQKSQSRNKVIVSESVFSMDGDLAPLEDLAQLAVAHDAWLVIDEAHATGVFGPRGLGRLEDLAQTELKLVSVHTGGKALGGQGAFVLSRRRFREFLINKARSFIFSTALSPLSAVQIQAAVKKILLQPQIGARLLETSRAIKTQLAKFAETGPSQSQILPIIVGSNERALQTATALQELGFDIRPIRSPTVAKGSERLRVTLKSIHSPENLSALVGALQKVLSL